MARPPAPFIRFKDSRCVKDNCANLVYLHQWRVFCKAHGETHHYEERVHPEWADHCKEFEPEDYDSKHGKSCLNTSQLEEHIVVLTEV